LKTFIDRNFLLHSDQARHLYHDYARDMPVFDFHTHLSIEEIANDVCFPSITQAWLKYDHYKWRLMRSSGIGERDITGDASDKQKFRMFAKTLPYAIRNPVYHWGALELSRYFGVNEILDESNADGIFDKTGEMLRSNDYSARNLLRMMNVRTVCTTDDPVDDLALHGKIREDRFDIRVSPTFRPDKALKIEDRDGFSAYLDKLRSVSGIEIRNYGTLIEAIGKRHDFFDQNGCFLSDHALDEVFFEDSTEAEKNLIIDKLLLKKELNGEETQKYKTAVFLEICRMNHARNWAQQFHIGALRNNNSLLYERMGADKGFDSIRDGAIAVPLNRLMDALYAEGKLAKTILYNLNPAHNEVLLTAMGNFQCDAEIPGKVQYGPAWWFLDSRDGMERQLMSLGNSGMLSRFVGMATDSRSLLSFPRHEYFRRVLCAVLGGDMSRNEIPDDIPFIGGIVQDICYHNAARYFERNAHARDQ
jgi:glucuronate isomerase